MSASGTFAQSETNLGALLAPVETACAELVAALRAALPDAPPQPAAVSSDIDWGSARQLVARLDSLLADDDSDAVELLRESAPLFKAALGTRFAEIERALDSYDLVQALAALRQARGENTALQEDAA